MHFVSYNADTAAKYTAVMYVEVMYTIVLYIAVKITAITNSTFVSFSDMIILS